jgi:hypothetical protein
MQKKKLFFLLIIVGTIFFFSRCMDAKNDNDPRGTAYAGSEACIKCHQSVYSSYLHTAHYQSASPASENSIAGSFSKDSNTFIINDSMKIAMEKQDDFFYQVLYIKGRVKEAKRFDIVFGNVKGQTYLYWKNDMVFQLPVSYFNTLHSWTSSPGYTSTKINFERPVIERCFECHTSFINQVANKTSIYQNAFDKKSLIYNIDCERCHGPAAAHVRFQKENPSVKESKYISSFKSLSRDRKINMCAICHSGNKNFLLKSTFGFKPGDTLANFMLTDNIVSAKPDVHGNQTQLLAMSKCFINSNMDCSTCHNAHINDRGNKISYSQKCMTCHSAANHNFYKKADTLSNSFLKNNCTTCHMPQQPSNAIVVQTTNNKTNIPCFIVNHKIAIYPEESKQIIEENKNQIH